MRRDFKFGKSDKSTISDKIILYTLIGITILALIVFALLMYSKNMNEEVRNETMTLEQMSKAAEQSEEETQSTGTEIGKSIEEAEQEIEDIQETASNTVTENNTKNVTNTNSNVNLNTTNNTVSNTTKETTNTENKEKTQELNFQKPVEGEIVREYAKDNLIYSETLEEWVTHMGIDIKADKTSVVKSAEAGTVKSIKNDPRYGLTVVVEHANNFQTVYSNLLSSEFVVEGEKIEKGQAIGTVGNTAVFEIADEPHLHFEILKDSLQVDPSIYIK